MVQIYSSNLWIQMTGLLFEKLYLCSLHNLLLWIIKILLMYGEWVVHTCSASTGQLRQED